MFIGNLLFFLMMVAPRTWQLLKIPLVFLVVLLTIVHYFNHANKVINRKVLIWFVLLLFYGVLWSFIGIVRGNDGAIDLFRINVVWVVLYACFVFYLDSIDKFESLILTIVLASIAISSYNLLIVMHALDYIPNVYSFLSLDSHENIIGLHKGYIQLTSNNIGMLTYIAPFLLAVFILKPKIANNVPRWLMFLSIALTFLTVVLSGRRALWLEVLVTPLLILPFSFLFYDKNTIKISKIVINLYISLFFILIVFANTSSWNYSDTYQRFTDAFVTESVRQEQAMALWNGFIELPLFGSGFGAGVDDVVRDDEHPWSYELSYMLILYNTGLAGSILYLLCIALIFYYGFSQIQKEMCDKNSMLCLFVGLSAFLIANATNPYLASYDYMWILFFPIVYINIIYNSR